MHSEDTGEYHVFIPDLLPEVKICNKRVRCHLSYAEVDREAPLLKAADNPAIVEIDVGLRDKDGEVVEIQSSSEVHYPIAGGFDDANQRSLLFKHFWDVLERQDVAQIEFRMMIVVRAQDCPGHGSPVPNMSLLNELAALRREHVARELTTGYRRYVSLLLVLCSCAAWASRFHKGRRVPQSLIDVSPANHVVHSGIKSPQSELHSTREDAWRLLCTFHTIEVAAKKVNGSKIGCASNFYVLSLQDFASSLTEADADSDEEFTSERIIEYLFTHKQIKREIALRKSLEYYIYESIPCLPN